ncbi:MAG: DoxX family protein [Pyrinomonadaceae bacterium]|nr:DoxX family protein [Pyrinomonadaceae bacterium]
MLKKVLFGGESGLSPTANLGLTVLRIATGLAMAFGHGLGKMPPGPGLIERSAQMGFPAPSLFAWAAAFSEFFGGLFLAIGLFTRLSSFLIGCTMLTALVGVHAADPFAAQEKAFLYLFLAVAFMLKGSGDWSIDGLIRK